MKESVAQNPNGPDGILEYDSGDTTRRPNNLARAAIVLGILGILITPVVFFTVLTRIRYPEVEHILAASAGPILLVLAVIFGAISLMQKRKNPQFRRDRGFGIAGLVVGSFGLLMVFPLLFLAGWVQEKSIRAASAANLRAISQAMASYESANPAYPMITATTHATTETSPESGH